MNRHRNLSFYIESLVLLFFLLAALVVLLRVFGAAQAMGQQARQKTDSALILQTVSAEFSAGEDPFAGAIAQAKQDGQVQVQFSCDTQGNVAEDGTYTVTADLQAETTGQGTVIYAQIEIGTASEDGQTDLAQVKTALYCPDAVERTVQP